MSKVRSVHGFAGGVTPESYGQEPGRDVTHLAVPLAIVGGDVEEATLNAQSAGEAIASLAATIPYVRWITSPVEATYALMGNVATALAQLTDDERNYVLRVSPTTAMLRALLEIETTSPVYVVDTAAGAMIVPGPGRYATPPDGAFQEARRARLAELAAMGQDDETAKRVDRDGVRSRVDERHDVAGAEDNAGVVSDADPGL